jgi:ABC-type glycerol-3-phosphate transport system permease component
MPIISPIEAKRTRGKLLYAAMFLALSIGGLTMLYPFAIMVSGSLRSELDETDLDLVPDFFVDLDVLYRKFLELKYNEDVAALNRGHTELAFSFRLAPVPQRVDERQVADFRRFLEDIQPPQHWRVAGAIASAKRLPHGTREMQAYLHERFGGSLDAFSQDVGSPTRQWIGIRIPPPIWLSRQFGYQHSSLWEAYFHVAEESDWAEQQLVSLSGYFREVIIGPTYGTSSTDAYNSAHTRPLESFAEFRLPRTVPGEDEPQLRREWIEFVTRDLNPSFVVLRSVIDQQYQQFLRGRYDSIAELNRAWNTSFTSFDEPPLPRGRWLPALPRQDYIDFLLTLPPQEYELIGPEYAWRDWLARTYGGIDAINAAYETSYASIEQIAMPVEQMEYAFVADHSRSLRWRYATANYRQVISEIFLQGNAFRNTMVLCALAVAMAIFVNPLAAYAMSRYRLRGTYNILLILMATVAFPPMVTLIPKFIMLREMNLLNTFAALVLPFAANGYLIFLLKCFFDSLPRELYEAAAIDGASELRIFWQITMSLSKPILAVIALEAFNAAYTMFLYALIVCPSEDMWVQTVWLLQFQNRASTGAMFASVLITCIPTLLIFIFAQRVIMRGIIVPTEK